DPSTRLEPKSNKESLEVEITTDVQLVNVNEEEEESAEDDYELKRKERWKNELTVNNPPPSSSTPSSSSPKPKLYASQHILSLFKPKTGRFKRYKNFFDELQGRYEISLQINNAITNHIPSQVDSSVRNYMSGHIFHVHPTQATPAFTKEQQYQLYLTMRDNPQLQQDELPIWLALKYNFERFHVSDTPCRTSTVRPRDQDDPYDDAHPEGGNSAKMQKKSEHGTYVFGESSSGQANESESGPSTSVSQDLVDEMSQIVDEAKLRKVVNEMLRQQYTSGDENQYEIDQMQKFLKNDILPKDPKAPALSLVNQDLLYLKKGSSGPEKIMMSLHKFPAVIFPDYDIKERTSRWVDKCVNKFNPYARYSVKHWKNPHAKIFYIKRQKESGKPKKKSTQIQRLFKSSKHIEN
ncbi:hypothetical protein Tco_0490183, partial [Tanacetum coccineum]